VAGDGQALQIPGDDYTLLDLKGDADTGRWRRHSAARGAPLAVIRRDEARCARLRRECLPACAGLHIAGAARERQPTGRPGGARHGWVGDGNHVSDRTDRAREVLVP